MSSAFSAKGNVEIPRPLGRGASLMGRDDPRFREVAEGGPYISGQWGGSCSKGHAIYLHIFQWEEDALVLPALLREVIGCEELGGEALTFYQTDEVLKLKITDGKKRSLHSVVKLTLADGPEIALIEVEGGSPKKQHGTLVNPMAGKKKK